jgi:hypothetical protein
MEKTPVVEYPRFLVRPDDHAIFELQPNNRYGIYDRTGKMKNKPRAYDHFSFEILTENYGWFPIHANQIPEHEAKNHEWNRIWSKYFESDGHDGIKGRDNLTPEEIEFIQLERD